MPNGDNTLFDRAEESGMSLATYAETRGHLQRGIRPLPVWPAVLHIPGDTTTPPVPGAIAIGPVDC